jgi:hypothetical protein
MREISGGPYVKAAFGHYRSAARGAFDPRAWTIRSRAAALGRRGASATKVLARGFMPALLIHAAAQDEMGFGIGLAKETVGWGALSIGGSIGLQMGGWAGATTGAAAGGTIGKGTAWALGKIPGVKKLGTAAIGKTVGRIAGAALGGPIGFILGGLAAYEIAKWGVGFALHTLPTFAKEFRADMTTSGYGGDYVDTAGAITMRQRSLQAMGRSHVNARSALGQEASLLHV